MDWQPCPRCGSNRVVNVGGRLGTFAVACAAWWAVALTGFLVPFAWVLLPFITIGGLVLLLLPHKRSLFCRDCHHGWRPAASAQEPGR